MDSILKKSWDALRSAVKNNSLLKNPLKGGKPAMDKVPTMVRVKDTGMIYIKPPSFRISRVPVSKSIIPTTIKGILLGSVVE